MLKRIEKNENPICPNFCKNKIFRKALYDDIKINLIPKLAMRTFSVHYEPLNSN